MRAAPPLLLTLLIAHGTAFAASPNQREGGIRLTTDRGNLSLDWDEREYDWWQDNCLNVDSRNSRIKLDCEDMDGKYRDHHDRSIHSGNNPGKGHDKHDDGKDKAKGKHKNKE